MNAPEPAPVSSRRIQFIWLAALLLAGAWFRLAHLGSFSMRADEINFWNICQQDMAPQEIGQRWMQIMGHSGHFPFPNVFIKWFLDTFQLPLNHVTFRLPSALWGILCVAAAFALGFRLNRLRGAVLTAALVAFNPYLIQTSREAYFYSPLMLGAFLVTWCLVAAADDHRQRRAVSWGWAVLSGAGFFLLTHSQPSGLSLAVLALVILLALMAGRWRATRTFPLPYGLVLVILAGLAYSLFTAPWGVEQLRYNISAAHVGQFLDETARKRGSLWLFLARALGIFSWGTTGVRVLFTLLVAGAAGWALRRRAAWRLPIWILVLSFVAILALNIMGLRRAHMDYDPRYLAVLLPAWLALLAFGLGALSEGVEQAAKSRLGRAVPGTAVGVALILIVSGYPAWLCSRMTGNPTPYQEIVKWVEAHLPRGTPVLVDRWLEPWNELRVYPSDHAYFTFTVPNEPLETYLNVNWRDTARQFFARYPQGAYLEVTKSYWEEPAVGPWSWPREYFQRQVAFTNTAGLALRRLGLASRADFYSPYTNRVVVELFYNTTDDVLQRAQAAGQRSMVLFGSGWGYTKTQDYQDWRVLEGAAPVELVNLTAEPLPAALRISGLAYGGSKQVRIGSAEPHVFEPGQLKHLHLGPFSLPPGRVKLVIEDSLYDMNRIPLLVSEIALIENPEVHPPPPAELPETEDPPPETP
jgi:4-amino-4-deoxy-L-arabinose transferase-like glycosyltransferase